MCKDVGECEVKAMSPSVGVYSSTTQIRVTSNCIPLEIKLQNDGTIIKGR
jgi:hypothetical protein